MTNTQNLSEIPNRHGYFVSPEDNDIDEVVDEAVVHRRVQKWQDMINRWSYFVLSRFDKVKERCRKGIPPAIRGKAWYHLSAAIYRQQNADALCTYGSVFSYYLTQTIDERIHEDIKKDLARSFPDHEMFRNYGYGQENLYNVLKAYAVHDPEVGYCQAQAPIASILLMHLPPEQAFWVFVQINEEYVKGYFSAGLTAVKEDAAATRILLKRVSPKGFNLLERLGVDPILYTVDWYMTFFSRTYRAEQLYRLWDMFFCEGVKVLFRLALVIVCETVQDGPSNVVSRAHECTNEMDLVTLIKQTAKQLPFSVLLSKMKKLPVTDVDLAQASRQGREQVRLESESLQRRK